MFKTTIRHVTRLTFEPQKQNVGSVDIILHFTPPELQVGEMWWPPWMVGDVVGSMGHHLHPSAVDTPATHTCVNTAPTTRALYGYYTPIIHILYGHTVPNSPMFVPRCFIWFKFVSMCSKTLLVVKNGPERGLLICHKCSQRV